MKDVKLCRIAESLDFLHSEKSEHFLVISVVGK